VRAHSAVVRSIRECPIRSTTSDGNLTTSSASIRPLVVLACMRASPAPKKMIFDSRGRFSADGYRSAWLRLSVGQSRSRSGKASA